MYGKLALFAIAVIIGYCMIDNFDPKVLRGKRVFVTGASMGIGEQIAYHYATHGADVVITARTESKLKKVVQKCRELGRADGVYDYVVADMSDLPNIKQVFKKATEKLGGLDYLVLNHIIPPTLGVWTGSAANLSYTENIMDVNYRSYVYLASYALPHLKQSKGSLVVVSSIAGKIAQPFLLPYCSSKFALDGFFSGLRQEFIMADVPVSVTLCIIGLTETDSAKRNLKEFGLNRMLATVSMAKPEDAAWEIIKGGATRVREIHFPYVESRGVTLLRDIFTEWIDALDRYFQTRDV